ncbi:MAG: hypothetical protein JSS23_09155 [Proteobacteria bacterium]|nr:hypothetical protein [Pseudomonadota bacterium]
MIQNIFAIQRIARMRAKQYAQARVDPLDTATRIRAQSALCGLRYRDGSTNPGTLTLAHAQDVLRWIAA